MFTGARLAVFEGAAFCAGVGTSTIGAATAPSFSGAGFFFADLTGSDFEAAGACAASWAKAGAAHRMLAPIISPENRVRLIQIPQTQILIRVSLNGVAILRQT
ncbi:hypothetical protein [Terrihabitans sp. B22-R8]|uniref:hypothetical protein n=1 Tax=Terrihabitans sp. B22-R8 TaxID=3425128 RepID=UPI00403C98F0